MPDSSASPATAARRLVETLAAFGVDRVFCVPGESYIAVLDALADFKQRIQVVACRHEASAANMAAAYGKLTGKPGICFVTRGPGATQASVGVHTAQQDSAPMILFVGQVAMRDKGREAFQEIDYAAMFGKVAKFAVEIDDPIRVVEIATRAFATAVQGRQGPCVVALPEDVLTADPGAGTAQQLSIAESALDPEMAKEIVAWLQDAERPLLILGGSGWEADALSQLAAWARRSNLPVVLSFRRKDLIDNRDPCYVGDIGLGMNPKLAQRIRSSDLLLTIGARLGENPTQGYRLLTPEETARKLIHIHPDPHELNRVWPAALTAVSGPAQAARALSAIPVGRDWSAWRAEARADYEAFTAPVKVTAGVNPSEVFAHLARTLPDDAIMCNGAGNYTVWLHRFYQHKRFGTQLAPIRGAMGFGLPAAIAAKLTHPERTVVAAAGDGCFLMAAQELATCVQYGVNVVTLVFDNGAFGTIRMHQERNYPGRVSATDLRNPDFAAYARAFGAYGATVTETGAFAEAFARALAANQPAVLHLRTSVEDILPGQSLSTLAAKR